MKTLAIGNIIQNLTIGDRVTINDWQKPFTVVAVSEHFVIVCLKETDEYSIISKVLSNLNYNQVRIGTYFCGPDNHIFSSFSLDELPQYIARLEDPLDELEISHRRRVTIERIIVEPKENANA